MNNVLNIPRIIHYCWFGMNTKPDIVERCIDSWRRNLVGYEIIEWNESNFDITSNTFVREAYETGKFAFVSDYVRVYALYHYGGIYLDTDVKVLKTFDDLLYHDSFWGFEQENYIATSTIGAAKGNQLIKIFLDTYSEINFLQKDGTHNNLTNVSIITNILQKHGLVSDGRYQEINAIGTFYPQTYFSPYDYINCRWLITKETYTIHFFYKSWLPLRTRIKTGVKVLLAKVIGGENILRIRRLLSKV